MPTLSNLNLMAPVDIDTATAALSVTQPAINDLLSRGFRFPQPPQSGYTGTVPHGIVHMTDEQLGDTLNEIASWLQWAGTQLALARAAMNEAEGKYETIKKRLRLAIKASSDKKLSNPEMEDQVSCDPRCLEAHRNYLFSLAVYDLTKALVEGGQRDWETVSRRITQRGQEVERNRRGENVGNVPVASSAFRR